LLLLDLLLLICSKLGLLNLSLVHGLGWRRGLLVNRLCSGLLLEFSFLLLQLSQFSLLFLNLLLLVSSKLGLISRGILFFLAGIDKRLALSNESIHFYLVFLKFRFLSLDQFCSIVR
jgi:hypothetical protein